MEKMLYFECRSGISGDMTVAALLDLGADREVLKRALDSLPVKGFRYEITRVKKAGLDACDFSVILDAEHENHDHDMAFLHGHEHAHGGCGGEHGGHEHVHGGYGGEHGDPEHKHGGQGHGHKQDETRTAAAYVHGGYSANAWEHVRDSFDHGEEGHDHRGHEHDRGHHGYSTHVHPHEHRSLSDILEIIQKAEMTAGAKVLAEKIFRILGSAEAKAHGVPMEEVHFHEVGAVDSIVDIVAAAVCADNLGITRAVIPVLCEGTGTVRCQHGILPVPVPAVSNIVQENGLVLEITGVAGELVTPTGAAIAAALKTDEQLPKTFRIHKIGLGAGKRTYERPSLLRVMVIEETGQEGEADRIYKLETDIDDCTGEMLGCTLDRLMKAGAREAHYTPVFMKKNRPAYELQVICTREQIEKMEEIIFEETTSIGIRRVPMDRTILERREEERVTPWGVVRVKVCTRNGHVWCYPEYDSVLALSQERGCSFREMYRLIERHLD